MTTKLQFVAALVIGLASATAQATTVSFGDSRDTTLYKSAGNNANGQGVTMFAGQDPGGSATSKRGLIAFDIAGNLPSGVWIQSVQLGLTFAGAAGSGGTPGNGDPTARQIDLHRMTSNWVEGTSGSANLTFSGSGGGFAASAGEATWTNQIHPSTPWATVGGGGDFAPLASAALVVGNPASSAVFTWNSALNPSMVADVQAWLNNPSQNFGWIVKANDENAVQSFRAFYTRDAAIKVAAFATFAPVLTVVYVPEPGTLTSLFVGVIGFILVVRYANRTVRSA